MKREWELYVIQHGPHISFSAMCWGYNVYFFEQETLGM